MTTQGTVSASVNGPTTAHELFALTDEQILEIEPVAADETALVEQPILAVPDTSARQEVPGRHDDARPVSATSAEASHKTAQARLPVLPEPPAWLAAQMNDPWAGEEARELWEGVQRAQAEAAEYKQVFEKPEAARAAAERARTLDEFDAAYFGKQGSTPEEVSAARTALAQRMLREDPAAFREMVFVGLRALEATSAGAVTLPNSVIPSERSESRDLSSNIPAANNEIKRDSSTAVRKDAGPSLEMTEQAALDYVTFEKAANADLEKNVGGAIERALRQALPNASRGDGDTLTARLSAGVRQEIEKALQGDRQLGEQVAQLLASRRFDETTRAQVVRLINKRAQQLVPSAMKRVLHDWTQTTLAAHRSKTEKQETASQRADLAPAQQGREVPPLRSDKDSRTSGRNDSATGRTGRIDYKKLSDEQILEL